MALESTNILLRSRRLVQDLRQEGRMEDAAVVEQLVQNLEQQAARAPFATTGEIAKQLGVSRQTVVNWIKRGYLPGVKLGGRLVVPAAELGRVQKMARLLDVVDAEAPAAGPEEIDSAACDERDRWTWAGKDR